MWLHKVKKWMSDESTWICFDPFWSIFEFLSLFRTRCAGDISSTITGRTLFPGHLLHGQTWQNSHVLASLLEKTWTWTHCLMSCRLLVKHNEESPLPPKLLEAQEKADMGSFIVFCCLNCLNAVLWYSSDIIGTLCMFFFFSWFCGMFSSILVMSLFSFFLLFSMNPSIQATLTGGHQTTIWGAFVQRNPGTLVVTLGGYGGWKPPTGVLSIWKAVSISIFPRNFNFNIRYWLGNQWLWRGLGFGSSVWRGSKKNAMGNHGG